MGMKSICLHGNMNQAAQCGRLHNTHVSKQNCKLTGVFSRVSNWWHYQLSAGQHESNVVHVYSLVEVSWAMRFIGAAALGDFAFESEGGQSDGCNFNAPCSHDLLLEHVITSLELAKQWGSRAGVIHSFANASRAVITIGWNRTPHQNSCK